MKSSLFSSLIAVTSLSLGAACAGGQAVRATSGIDVRLNAGADSSAPRPEGVLRVQGIHNGVSEYVPVASLDPGIDTQRVALPPGSYSVSYSPVVLVGALGSVRNRAEARILSANPFSIDVREGQFHAIDVRSVAGTRAAAAGPPGRPLASR
jgi:hypothetical protein